jgi:hypothetical protein
LHPAAAFVPLALDCRIDQEILERLQQERTETPARRIG